MLNDIQQFQKTKKSNKKVVQWRFQSQLCNLEHMAMGHSAAVSSKSERKGLEKVKSKYKLHFTHRFYGLRGRHYKVETIESTGIVL